ncbi:ac103 [Lambdina fiscellaria nucleopolyhedrovirus]|uniref:Ac103 n=1 Tax=Lambdina fiscellaria nucleopolyhedrovirus TaxID=1642929 RepID=A0A0E3URA9_9ABAC|nr:ac103 [Lambdina fiscellaria nucleopolyhedrovirus]AKC91675.1 ac103 [Lambdina fiscellaria nucleopolyhedrovirus]
MNTATVRYTLRFAKNSIDVKTVNFNVSLSTSEIDSLAFLFSKYFDQSKHVDVRGLTFFNEFNKCVDFVKHNFETSASAAADGQSAEVKRFFSLFLKHEFMGQVPHFKKIMQYLQKYYKPVASPCVTDISAACDSCPVNRLTCLQCKIHYLASAITTFDSGIQDGWDIFLRPMFGLPLFLFVLLRTDYRDNGTFNADDLITNSFAVFLRNLLCDKASRFVNAKTVQPLVDECRRITAGVPIPQMELLLCMLRSNNTCDTPLFTPFRNFIIQLACKTKIKQAKINKIASVVFTGFYLRLYTEGAANRMASTTLLQKHHPFGPDGRLTPFEMELRNVCRFVLPAYDEVRFERFVQKLANIRDDLNVEQYIVTDNLIRQLVSKHDLDEDFSVLLNQNV